MVTAERASQRVEEEEMDNGVLEESSHGQVEKSLEERDHDAAMGDSGRLGIEVNDGRAAPASFIARSNFAKERAVLLAEFLRGIDQVTTSGSRLRKLLVDEALDLDSLSKTLQTDLLEKQKQISTVAHTHRVALSDAEAAQARFQASLNHAKETRRWAESVPAPPHEDDRAAMEKVRGELVAGREQDLEHARISIQQADAIVKQTDADSFRLDREMRTLGTQERAVTAGSEQRQICTAGISQLLDLISSSASQEDWLSMLPRL